MVSKQSQVINFPSIFWCYVILLLFIFFFFTLCFAYGSNFISYFVSNQIYCSFCSFFNYSFRSSFAASIPVFVAISINFLPYLSPNVISNDKKPYPLTYFLNSGSVEYLVFIKSSQLLV